MHSYREPLPAFVKNALILLTSGIVASVLCAKVYGATLQVEQTGAPLAVAAQAQADARL